MNAKKAIKLAMILATKNTALAAPCAAASKALASVLFLKKIQLKLLYVSNNLLKNFKPFWDFDVASFCL